MRNKKNSTLKIQVKTLSSAIWDNKRTSKTKLKINQIRMFIRRKFAKKKKNKEIYRSSDKDKMQSI